MSENARPDPFNMSLRKFLKQVGVTSQRAIEDAAEEARRAGRHSMIVRAVVTAEGTDLEHVVEDVIDLGPGA